jgi:thiosulfate dehydrogenase (quinone) large subunit
MQVNLAALKKQRFEDPGAVRFLFGSPLMGFAWFFVRLYLGWQWLAAGWHKVYGDSSIGWVQDGTVNGKVVNAGDSILGFWTRAAAQPEPPARAAITYDWYRDFLQYMIDHRWNGWMTYVIAYGEFLVGLALILGAFTGFAALFGATLNFNFMLAGTAGTNPLLFAIAILMILAWKTAGYVGVDRWLLPALGTPWQPGRIFHRTGATAGTRPAAFHGAAGD